MMERFSNGDSVRIDIPDETDPDHQEYHGEHGRVVSVLSDDVDLLTADERDAKLYRVTLDSGRTADFRWRDLRPPIDDSSQA
jgi:ribosomal protein L21E